MRLSGATCVALYYCLVVSCGARAAESAESANVTIDALEGLSHKVVYVNTFGRFQSQGKNGRYRVFLLDAEGEYPHSKVYLQWIYANEDGKGTVAGTQAVTEINNAGVYKLSVPKISSEPDGSVIDVMAINQYSHNVQNLQIRPGEVNHYELRFSSASSDATVKEAVGNIPLSLDYYSRPTF